jgi:hypothetical protein
MMAGKHFLGFFHRALLHCQIKKYFKERIDHKRERERERERRKILLTLA